MKYVGRLILLMGTTLVAAGVNALTLNGVSSITVNGINCGAANGSAVTLGADGALSVYTNDTTSCAPGGGSTTGPYTLTVNLTGSGTVSKNPNAASYEAGTSVTLTATPSSASTFSGWGGACSGSDPTCQVDMTANKTVSASFTASGGGGDTACVSGNGLICKTATNWPVIPQSFLTGSQYTPFAMKYNEVLAIEVTTTAAGAMGQVATTYTTSGQATRMVGLSTSPGVFPPATINGRANPCLRTALSSTASPWEQGTGTSTSTCMLPPNSKAYINVKFTNCATGSSCKFFLSAQ